MSRITTIYDETANDRAPNILSQVVSSNNNKSNHSNDIYIKKDYDYEYIPSFNNWIKGIGDNFMWNNETESKCLFEEIPYKVSKQYATNLDYLYKRVKYCHRGRFTSIYNRIITTAHCRVGAIYYEDDGIVNARFPPPITTWKILEKQDGNIINLKTTTQSTWIGCGRTRDFHFSLLPLSKRNPTLYLEKSIKIRRSFEKSKAPNIILFVLDSTSRSNFFRGGKQSIHYLSELQIDRENISPSDILEFFRYSTVGRGTAENMNALIGGSCNSCSKHAAKQCVGLAQYFDNFGYYVWGLDEYRNNNNNSDHNKCDWYLGMPTDDCSHINSADVETAKNFAKQAMKLQMTEDRKVPYLLLLKTMTNHLSSKFTFQIDRYIRELIEDVDKENTIIHIIGDHGSKQGAAIINVYGQWEMRNPVSILMLPKWLNIYNRTKGYLKNLKINQQRFINQYDTHLFYKELLWRLYIKNDINFELNAIEFIKEKQKQKLYRRLIAETLAKIQNDSQSIIDTKIALNRSCGGIPNQYCFCDMLKKKEINDKIINDYDIAVKLIINTINNVTGNGNYDCNKLNPNDFTIQLLLENDEKTEISIVIEKKINDKEKRDKLLKKNGLLSFSVNLQRKRNTFIIQTNKIGDNNLKSPSIARIDWFKYEKCLTQNYNRNLWINYKTYPVVRQHFRPEPIFVNNETMIRFLKDKRNKIWTFRLCNCKT